MGATLFIVMVQQARQWMCMLQWFDMQCDTVEIRVISSFSSSAKQKIKCNLCTRQQEKSSCPVIISCFILHMTLQLRGTLKYSLSGYWVLCLVYMFCTLPDDYPYLQTSCSHEWHGKRVSSDGHVIVFCLFTLYSCIFIRGYTYTITDEIYSLSK